MSTEHDRYLIYQMLGRRVTVSVPTRFGRRRMSAVVERVYRDVFENVVELVMAGRSHVFREPQFIVGENGEVVFVYGTVVTDETDDVLFREIRSSYAESLYDVMRRTEPELVKKVHFKLGHKVNRRRRLNR